MHLLATCHLRFIAVKLLNEVGATYSKQGYMVLGTWTGVLTQPCGLTRRGG